MVSLEWGKYSICSLRNLQKPAKKRRTNFSSEVIIQSENSCVDTVYRVGCSSCRYLWLLLSKIYWRIYQFHSKTNRWDDSREEIFFDPRLFQPFVWVDLVVWRLPLSIIKIKNLRKHTLHSSTEVIFQAHNRWLFLRLFFGGKNRLWSYSSRSLCLQLSRIYGRLYQFHWN